MAELISVIVTTYERPDALDAVLRGLDAQTDRDFEIIIADDGSGAKTVRVVTAWQARMKIPVTHVWQENRGFRAAAIRNRAIRQSQGETCIFLDGDCIPRPDFVARHRKLSEPGWFVAGNRILLSPELTDEILREKLSAERSGIGRWFAHRLKGGINRLAPLLPLPLGPLRKVEARRWRGARSCNLAIRRSDLLRVDGFDSDFSGWGLEDSDLIIRLIRSGARRKDGRFATGVLHLWHPHYDRSRLPENQKKLDEVIRSDRVQAIAGLSAVSTDEAGLAPSSRLDVPAVMTATGQVQPP
jgi:glycosyltransferase involved in cell wall biosynthesis